MSKATFETAQVIKARTVANTEAMTRLQIKNVKNRIGEACANGDYEITVEENLTNDVMSALEKAGYKTEILYEDSLSNYKGGYIGVKISWDVD